MSGCSFLHVKVLHACFFLLKRGCNYFAIFAIYFAKKINLNLLCLKVDIILLSRIV